jgi:glycosyltransferase involved in cell wall biosynthesis
VGLETPTVGSAVVGRRVSVVVPAYNAEQYIRECLDSILAQEVPALEVIVVDDGSTDGTRKRVAEFGARVRYVWQPNSGECSAPRNHGARIARHEFLPFFDADDVMCPGKLAAQLEVLERQPAVELVVSDYVNFDHSGDSAASHFATCPALLAAARFAGDGNDAVLEPIASNHLLVRENFCIASSPLFRRAAFLQVGGFDETLRASEDFDLVYRIARRAPIAVLSSVDFRRRLHGDNMSNQTLRIVDNKIRSRQELLISETDPALMQALRASIAEFEIARCRALTDLSQPGSLPAYVRAARLAPGLALREWRVALRTVPLANRIRATVRALR